ncbi:MAG: hypothetical protein JNL82_05780 [Myxococcales bacterium]|nr:hypothetical protein [Myxococcales bacterium]
MPRATACHPFEWRIHAWAVRLRDGAGFLALLDERGDITRVVEADRRSFGNHCVAHAVMTTETAAHPRWIYYDPFDAPEYAWLAWQGIVQTTWNRLLDDTLAPPQDIPPSWGVMF